MWHWSKTHLAWQILRSRGRYAKLPPKTYIFVEIRVNDGSLSHEVTCMYMWITTCNCSLIRHTDVDVSGRWGVVYLHCHVKFRPYVSLYERHDTANKTNISSSYFTILNPCLIRRVLLLESEKTLKAPDVFTQSGATVCGPDPGLPPTRSLRQDVRKLPTSWRNFGSAIFKNTYSGRCGELGAPSVGHSYRFAPCRRCVSPGGTLWISAPVGMSPRRPTDRPHLPVCSWWPTVIIWCCLHVMWEKPR